VAGIPPGRGWIQGWGWTTGTILRPQLRRASRPSFDSDPPREPTGARVHHALQPLSRRTNQRDPEAGI